MSRDVDNFNVGIVINNSTVDKFIKDKVINMTRCHCLWGVDKFVVGSYQHDSVTLLIIRWGI